ncbi:hypothetical protein K502DRAFT_342897 [Neoconidiobolus thromboides FSU 785]|nr:hypothetical protein K502DRAFT_342897 [Neoconidiobolus thromboides FSU 785]
MDTKEISEIKENKDSAPLTRVSGRVWKDSRKPSQRNMQLKLGKNTWKLREEERKKEAMLKEHLKQLKEETENKKKARGEALAAKRIKKEAKTKEEALRNTMSAKRYDRMQRKLARKAKIAAKKAEKIAQDES